jgi:hypothetical protein
MTVRGYTPEQVSEVALATHGGNYRGEAGEFHWSNKVARNTIRHNLTNYERLLRCINRGETAEFAYRVLRACTDELVDEAYPEYWEGAPEVNPGTAKKPSPSEPQD